VARSNRVRHYRALNYYDFNFNNPIKEDVMKRANVLTGLLAVVAGLGIWVANPSIAAASAHEIETTIGSGWYYSGQSASYNFGSATVVDRLMINVQGTRRYSEVQVYADGEWVARLGVPGNDPEYPVVIRKRISNVTLYFSDEIYVREVRAFIEDPDYHREQNEIRTV
jgi:hypothetical protein